MKLAGKKQVLFFSVLFTCLSYSAFASGKADIVSESQSKTVQDQQSSYPKYDTGVQCETSINYPLFKDEPELNAYIVSAVRSSLAAFTTTVFRIEEGVHGGTDRFECVVNADSVYENSMYISFLLSVYEYTGGAHGTTHLIPVTYSKKTKKILSLKELIQPAEGVKWLEKLSNEAESILKKRLKTKSFMSNEEWIKKGTEPVESHFSLFKLQDAEHVKIVFAHYQVAAYAQGMPEVVIPLQFFKE